MVIKLLEKPEGHLEDIQDKCIFFEFIYNDEPYAYFAFQLFGESTIIHNDVTRWNHNIAKAAKADFEYLQGFLKTIGVKKIIALYPEFNKKWTKFIKMFGFPEPKQLMSSIKEI